MKLLLLLLKRVLCCVVPAAEGVVALLSCCRDLCDEAVAPCGALVKVSCWLVVLAQCGGVESLTFAHARALHQGHGAAEKVEAWELMSAAALVTAAARVVVALPPSHPPPPHRLKERQSVLQTHQYQTP